MSISQNEATRFVSVIDERVKRLLGRGTVLEITYGDVDIVNEREASVFIGGDVNASNGFRIPSGLHIEDGDRVKVAIDPRGYRYVQEVLAPTNLAKAEFDPVRGEILFGDGTAEPDITISRVSSPGLTITGGGLTVESLRTEGDLVVGEATTESGTGIHLKAVGGVELVGTTPYVDFKNDALGEDFDVRLILASADVLDIAGGSPNIATGGQSYKHSGTQVVGSRKTGWGSPTGTATRSAFATSSVTLPQLAERLKALIDDLTTHGLIGS